MLDQRLRDATDGVKVALVDMVPPPIDSLLPAARRRTRWWAIAVAAAATVFLVIGAIALIGPFAGEESTPITDPSTASTVPVTTAPVVPVPDATVPDVPVSGPLESGFINDVQDLALAPDGAVWVATRGGVIRWDPGRAIPVVFGEGDGLPAADVNQIAVAADGTVWAAGHDWVAYFDQTWQSVEADDPWFWTLVADPRGGVWTTNGGDQTLVHIDRSGIEQISLPGMMGLSSSVWIAVDGAGRVYATDAIDVEEAVNSDVVYIYEEGTWRELTTLAWPAGGTYSNIVTNIAIAPNGTLWISTTSDSDPEPEGSPAHGVASFDGEVWTTYTTADGLASDAGIVEAAPDGTVWVVHRGAVSRFDGDTWTAHDVAVSSRSGAVAGPDGTLWLGTNNGVIHIDGATTTRFVVPDEMAPGTVSFSLEPVAPAAPPFNAGLFGDVAWQRFDVPAGHSLTRGIDTAHGFAAIADSAGMRTSVDGLGWTAIEPPFEARHLVASGDDLYVLGSGAVRLAWTGTTWEVVDELVVPEPGAEIRSEGGYLDFAERMAFGDGVSVMTARSQVFFSTDGDTYVPALRGPDPALLEGAREPDSDSSYAGGCETSWNGGGPGEGSIGPVLPTGTGFVAFTSGHPNDWNNIGLCRPVIWRSNDGSTWDLVSSESPFGGGSYVYAMAERDGRFVAVGGNGGEGLLWVSNDGVTWSEIPPERISRSITSAPWAISAGEAGWVALYGQAGTQEEVRAMYSLDGLEWVVDADALPDFWWAWGTPDVAVGKDRILVTYYNGVALLGEITR